MGTHFVLHIRLKAQVRTRLCGAEQNESSFAVLGKIADRIAWIEISRFEQPPGACEAAALVADCGKCDSRFIGGVPDVLGRPHLDCVRALGCYQRDLENFRSGFGRYYALPLTKKNFPRQFRRRENGCRNRFDRGSHNRRFYGL